MTKWCWFNWSFLGTGSGLGNFSEIIAWEKSKWGKLCVMVTLQTPRHHMWMTVSKERPNGFLGTSAEDCGYFFWLHIVCETLPIDTHFPLQFPSDFCLSGSWFRRQSLLGHCSGLTWPRFTWWRKGSGKRSHILPTVGRNHSFLGGSREIS